jgi:hypothetical protein
MNYLNNISTISNLKVMYPLLELVIESKSSKGKSMPWQLLVIFLTTILHRSFSR